MIISVQRLAFSVQRVRCSLSAVCLALMVISFTLTTPLAVAVRSPRDSLRRTPYGENKPQFSRSRPVLRSSFATEGGTIDIRDAGAVGDGKTINTTAIQTAIDRCAETGGGRVVVPPGRFLSGTIVMKSGVELHIDQGAVLLGSTDHDDYPRQPTPKYRSHKDRGGFYALIYAEGAENIAVTGSGTIDGQGKDQKPRHGSGDLDGRPRVILFISCRGIRVEGLHLRNSGIWMQHYLNCENVIVRGLDVWNHSNRNNDAIDIDGCRRVCVSDCNFDTDDDGITLKSTGPAPSEDVVITNCTISSHCNAIKAGTETTGGFRRISISNCVISPSASDTKPIFGTPKGGISGISLELVDGGTLEGITITNITMTAVQVPLFIRLGNRARTHIKGAPKPPVGVMRNIALSNIVAYGTGSIGSSITGIPGHYIENITLDNIQLFSKGGIEPNDFSTTVAERENKYPEATMWGHLPAFGLFLRHVRGISIHGLVLGVDKPDARPPLWAEDVHGLSVSGSRVVGTLKKGPFLRGSNLSDWCVDKPLGWPGKALAVSN